LSMKLLKNFISSGAFSSAKKADSEKFLQLDHKSLTILFKIDTKHKKKKVKDSRRTGIRCRVGRWIQIRGDNMKLNSIVTKLWLAITALVLMVIGITGLVHTDLMDKIYYQQQANQLISTGHRVADLARTEKNTAMLEAKLDAVSGVMDNNIMIINSNNGIHSSAGMGIESADMLPDLENPYHIPLTENDLEKLSKGETIIYRGRSEFFQTDVLSVAMPVKDATSGARIIMIHAPLKPLAGQLASFKIITFYTAVGGIILATILSMFFSRQVARPLLDMNRVALAMASGDFLRQVKVNTNDEVGLLANSLNTLSVQLQEKLAQLERLDRARREFVANVSHEIKTPLTIMQGFTEALLDNLATDEDERKSYLNNIAEEIKRLRRLVNDILDLNKIEEGRFDFVRDYVDLNSVSASVQQKFRALAEESGIELTFNIDKKTPPVYGSQDMIKQVYFNLIDNAIRHTPAGGKILVTAFPKADQVMVQVKDTGRGIPAEDLPMIWERFYKADKSRTRGQGGTGLGLAIVKRIIETHGGWISVESKPGTGTTFTFILPTGPRKTHR